MAGEAPAEIMEMVEGAGGVVTRDQLVRWHRAGLIPRPAVEYLGRGKGTASYYPAGTAAQVIALLDLQKRRRRLADVAWLLWWAGYPVREEVVRARLVKVLDAWSAAFETMSAGEAAEAVVASVAEVRLPSRTLRWARQRVGRDDLGPWLLRLVEGLRDGGESAHEVDLARLGRVVGLEETGDAGRVAETLTVVSRVLRPSALRDASDSSLGELATVRDKIKQFLLIVGTFGEISLQTRGRWTPRLGAYSVFLAEAAADPDGQALILLAWRALESSGLGGGASEILALAGDAESAGRAWAAIGEIRAALPPDEAYLVRPKRLGRAQNDPKEYERLQADLRQIRQRWGAEIDAILRAHQVEAEPEASRC